MIDNLIVKAVEHCNDILIDLYTESDLNDGFGNLIQIKGDDYSGWLVTFLNTKILDPENESYYHTDDNGNCATYTESDYINLIIKEFNKIISVYGKLKIIESPSHIKSIINDKIKIHEFMSVSLADMLYSLIIDNIENGRYKLVNNTIVMDFYVATNLNENDIIFTINDIEIDSDVLDDGSLLFTNLNKLLAEEELVLSQFNIDDFSIFIPNRKLQIILGIV